MPTYVGFHALGSIIAGVAKSAVHGVSLGSQPLTPASIAQMIRSAEILGFEYGMETPHDSGSGKPTGRRPHKLITVTKEVDASSPLLFQACVTNETLPALTLNFYRSSSRSKGRPSFAVTLTNASVASIRRIANPSPRHSAAPNTHELEKVSFAFQKIDISNVDSKTTSTDDWKA